MAGLLNPGCIELGDTGELNVRGDPRTRLIKFTIREKMLKGSIDRASVTLSPEATFNVLCVLAKGLSCQVVDATGKVVK